MEKFLNYFQKYAILKILLSFVSLFLICWFYDLTSWNIFKYLIWIPGAYLIVTWVSLVISLVIRIRNERINAKSDLFKK